MHEQHCTTAKGYSLPTDSSGVPILHVVLDQLMSRSYKDCLRHYGDSEPYDPSDTLVDVNILKLRGHR